MRDGIVPVLSGKELGAGRDCRVSVGTDALSCEPCRWGMGRWFSVGESYVDVEPDRIVLGGFCQELEESCERRREWLERGERLRDEFDPGRCSENG